MDDIQRWLDEGWNALTDEQRAEWRAARADRDWARWERQQVELYGADQEAW